jgi:hypothetical protein
MNLLRQAVPTTANAGPDQNICVTTTTATLAGNTPTMGTGSWSVVSGIATITNPTSPTSGITGMGSGNVTLRWTISNPPCAASTDDVTITKTAEPTPSNAGSDQSSCNVGTFTLAANSPTLGTGAWSKISGAGSVTSPAYRNSGVTGVTTGTTVFRWTITNGPCTSTDDVALTRAANPTTSDAGPDQSGCEVTSFTLAGNVPTVGGGIWSVITGSCTITDPTLSTTTVTSIPAGTSAKLRWTISNAPCTATISNVILTNNQAPSTANAGPDQAICNTGNFTLAANSPAVGTGTWTKVSGTGTITTSSSPTTTITAISSGTGISGTFRWTISSTGCPSSSDDVNLTKSATPTTANAGTDKAAVCNSITTLGTSLSGNAPTAGIGLWSVISGTATITDPTNRTSGVTGMGTSNITLRWTISNAPCTASSDDMLIPRISGCKIGVSGEAPDVEPEAVFEVQVNPNPYSDQTLLTITNAKSQYVRVMIVDVNGKTVYENNYFPNNNSLPVGEGLASGTYFLKVIEVEEIRTIKIIKIK